jgi:hypothetical protein
VINVLELPEDEELYRKELGIARSKPLPGPNQPRHPAPVRAAPLFASFVEAAVERTGWCRIVASFTSDQIRRRCR